MTDTISSTEKGEVAYTNIRDTGDLIISKTVAGNGGEEDRVFDFTLTLEKNEHGANVDDDYKTTLTTTTDEGTTTQTGALTVKGGTASFKLTHGQTLTIEGIPEGTKYTVTETDYTAEGYVTTVGTVETRTATGVIEVEEGTDERPAFTAAFTNERNVGNLTITKELEGTGTDASYPNVQESYHIKVELTAPENVDLVGSYTAPIAEQSGTLDVTATAEGATETLEFDLKGDQSVEFTGLPEGTKYTPSPRRATRTLATRNRSSALNRPPLLQWMKPRMASSTSPAPIPGEEGKNSVAITVANERNTGSLSVEKIVEGTGAQPEKVFTFTLQLTHNDGVQLKGKYPTTITTVNDKGESTTVAGEPLSVGENGQATFTLKHGQTLTINGIPEGTAYTVTETVPTADGYQQTDANAAQSGTIGNGTTAAASFTNERNVYGLDVEKTLSGNGVDSLNALTEFAVTVKLARAGRRDPRGRVHARGR